MANIFNNNNSGEFVLPPRFTRTRQQIHLNCTGDAYDISDSSAKNDKGDIFAT